MWHHPSVAGLRREELTMLQTIERHDTVELGQLLAGAARTIRNVRYCWLVTRAEDGGANPRAMGRMLHDGGEDAWTLSFVTDGRSRKVADMRRDGRVTLIFQHDPEDAYLTLFGKAVLRDSESDIRARWKDAFAVYFPTETDRANAVFAEVAIDRMELWIRGVTPDPFGMKATILQRDKKGEWQVSFR
jgi:general stress protein 26